MFRTQGKHLNSAELERIISLLRESELTIAEIAARMNCSRSAIAALNRKLQIRQYHGLRTRWITAVDSHTV